MKDKYNPDIAWVYSSDLEPTVIIGKNPLESLKSVIRRMNVEYTDGLPKEVYASILKEKLYEDNKWILQMLPKEMIDFCIQTIYLFYFYCKFILQERKEKIT